MDLKYIFFQVLTVLVLIQEHNAATLDIVATDIKANGTNNESLIINTFEGVSDDLTCLVHTDDDGDNVARIYNTGNTNEHEFITEFEPAGDFNIYMSCYGSMDFIATRKRIYVGKFTIIKDLELAHNSPNASNHPWSDPISISIHLPDSLPEPDPPLVNTTCMFQYGSRQFELRADLTNGSNITHTIDLGLSGIEDGEFVLTVNCSNRFSHQILNQTFFVVYTCWERNFFDNFYKLPENAQTAKTNAAKMVTATLEFSDDCAPPIQTRWTVYALKGVNEGSVVSHHSDTSQVTKTFRANTMDEGHYKVELTVNISVNDKLISASDFLYLNFTIPDLLPEITVNNINNYVRKISLAIGQENDLVEISTRDTIDPAEGLNSVASVPMTKTMSCETNADWDEEDVLKIIEGESAAGVIQPCTELIPADVDSFSVAPEKITLNQWYIFTLTVNRGQRSARIFQAIQLIEMEIPVLEFQCVSNCERGPSNFDKLILADLQVNVLVHVDASELVYISYIWKFEKLENGNTDIVDMSNSGPGYKVEKGIFEKWISTKYILSCTVNVPGYSEVTIYNFYSMSQAPYNGNCSLNVEDTPVVTGETKICIHCFDWKDEDEGINHERTPLEDNGGSLLFAPVQIFLKSDGQVNESIPEIIHAPLAVVDRCFTILRPPNTESNYTRIEVRVMEKYQEPYAKIKFDDIKIKYRQIRRGDAGAADVHTLYAAFLKEINSSKELHDVLALTDTVNTVTAEINTQLLEETPMMAFTDFDPDTGGLTDILPNGTALSFSDIINELEERQIDPMVLALRETNGKIVNSLYEVSLIALNVTDEHNLLQILQIAKSVLLITSQDEINFNDKTLEMLVNITRYIFNVAENLTDESPLTEEIKETCVAIIHSLVNVVVPDTLSNMEVDTNIVAQRQRSADALRFASDDFITTMEKNASMFEEERVFYYSKQLSKIKLAVEKKHDLVTDISEMVMPFYTSLVKNSSISYGAETVIGNTKSYAKMLSDFTYNLANKKITSATTLVNFQGLDPSSNTILRIGLMETQYVMNLDKEGKAAKITSNQKQMIIKGENESSVDFSDTVTFMHQISHVEPAVHFPLIHPEDPSKFDYYIVHISKSYDDLYVLAERLSERVEKYMIYIFYTDEDKRVSKIEYTAKAESGPPYYTAYFPPGVRGLYTGVWQIGIETIFKASLNSERFKRSDGGEAQGTNGTDINYPAYNFATVTGGCMTWDYSSRSWRTDECKGTWIPQASELRCKCNVRKEMTFANSFSVAPNKIDYNTVFLKFSPLNQAAVIGVLCVIFGTYILVICWARKKDRTDLLKWGITPMSDNFPDDNYFYVIKIFTGMRPRAGTRSRVSMVIAGDDNDTGRRQLVDGVRNEFSTGSVMKYLMSTSLCLGNLECIRIWHDNSGSGSYASWYLSKIEVEDIQLNEKYTFLVGRWLAIDEDDGRLDCMIPVTRADSLNKFKNRMFENLKENIAESHMWLSIAYRPQSSNFTRKQRASCALMFVMLTMITNAMFFRGSNEENYELPTQFQVGPFRLSLQQLYEALISVLIVTPATLLVICVFKLSRYQPNDGQVLFEPPKRSDCCRIPVVDTWLEKEQLRSVQLERTLFQKGYPEFKGFRLPSKCVYLAWVIVVVTTVVSAFHVILYSMEWGKQKSEEWVSMMLLSIFQSIFCLDPIKVILIAVIFAMIFRKMSDTSDSVLRSNVLKYYSSSFRGRFDGVRLPTPEFDKTELKKALQKREKERKVAGRLYDSISSTILIWILMCISNSMIDTRSYKLHQQTVDTFIKPLDSPAFTKIQSTSEFYTWLNKTAIIKAFPEIKIDDAKTPLHWRERLFIEGGNLFRVGPPRLRQLRVTKQSCWNKYMGSEDCFKAYSLASEDTKSYCIGWGNEECNPKEPLYNYSSNAWKRTSSVDIWGLPTSGYYSTYGGGGYIAKFSVNRQVSQMIVNELYRNTWIDRKTRAVLFEFTLFSPNTNIFTYNILMVEFPETGGAFPYYTIFPLRVYLHLGPLGMYSIACEIIFLIYLILYTINITFKILKQEKAFFKSSWQVFDLIFTVIGYIAIVMYIIQLEFTNKSLEVFRKDKKEFVNFHHVAIWNQMIVLFIGILVFMAVVRMLKIFGYSKRIRILANVFSNAAKDLISFAVFFLFIFVSYSALGYLLFGSNIRAYKTVVRAMETLFVSILGKSRFAEIDETDPVMAKVYFMLFVGGVVYLTMTIFFNILCAAIDEAHKQSTKGNVNEVVRFILDKLQNLIGYRSNRLSSGQPPTMIDRQTDPNSLKWRLNREVSSKEILLEIRTALSRISTPDISDFPTPSEEKCMKKVRFKR